MSNKFEITGTIEREVTDVFRVKRIAKAVQMFMETYHTLPEVINGRDVMNVCEACGDPIFKGDTFGYGGEGQYICKKCL